MIKFNFNRKLLADFDWIMLLLALLISAAGVVIIYSATGTGVSGSSLYIKQFYWIVYGTAGLLIIVLLDYHYIERLAYILYAVMIVMLVAVYYYGKTVGGAQRWLSVGLFNIQPSEISKIIIIITLTRYFDDNKTKGPFRLMDLKTPCFIVAVPFLLIAKQPDLGTSIILIVIFVATSLTVGIERKSLYKLFFGTTATFPLLWFFLKDYQKTRILTLFNPDIDPLGAGYHVIQSKIAIGSGGLFGKGLLSGTQSQLNFLPEKHTDFIFSVFSEELGFVGSSILLILFFLLIIKGIDTIYNSKDIAGSLMGTGCVALLTSHVVVNIAMTTGIFPVVGIPLPLMSYGGSFMITCFSAIALLINIRMRRYQVK